MRRVHPRFLVLAALIVTACDDRSPSLTAPDAVRVGHASGALRDAGILTGDSWLTAVVTTTTDGAADIVEVEAGYGSRGELRFGMYWTPNVPSVPLAGIRYIGDRVELLNAAGAVTGSNTFNGHATNIGLPGGTLAGALLDTQDPGAGGCHPSDPSCLATVMSDPTVLSALARSPDERRVRHRARPARTPVALSGDADYADIERVYRRQRQANGAPDLWRLEEITEERRTTTDRGSDVSRKVTTIRYTRYQMNAAKERARLAAFRAAPVPTAAARAAVASAAPQTPVVPVAGDDADGILDPFCRQGTRNDHSFRTKTRGGLSFIYQHGFCSDASAFDGYRPRIASSIGVSRERAYSLNSTLGIADQVADLTARIAEAGPSRNIVIGHSQGGLVARRFGQLSPQYVSSVITIGTPQGGSLLAALGPDAINEIVTHITSDLCVTPFLCDLIANIAREQLQGRLSVALLDNGAPSLRDMHPESEFLATLNSTYEPFARASVETDIDNRWALARMVGDGRSPVSGLLTDQRPGGDALVTQAEHVYRSAQALRLLTMFTLFYKEALGFGVNCGQSGYMTYWEPCSGSGSGASDGLSWFQTVLAINTLLVTSIVIDAMNAVDRAWDYATTRGQSGTDGLIHSYSQRYPDSPGAFLPERFRVDGKSADSHSGQLASPTTFQRTMDAVRALASKNP